MTGREGKRFGKFDTKEAYEKYLPCYHFADEVDEVLENPGRLKNSLPDLSSVELSRQQFHLIRALVNGNFILKEGHYSGFLMERIRDEEVEATRKGISEIGNSLDKLIESLQNEKMTLAGYLEQGQTQEYQARMHLVIGVILFRAEINAEMLELLEEVTHGYSGDDFRTLFSLYTLYSKELDRRIYIAERC